VEEGQSTKSGLRAGRQKLNTIVIKTVAGNGANRDIRGSKQNHGQCDEQKSAENYKNSEYYGEVRNNGRRHCGAKESTYRGK